MKRAGRAMALAAVLPLAGCIFAVNTGGREALEKRVEKLEKRVDHLEKRRKRSPQIISTIEAGEGVEIIELDEIGTEEAMEIELEEEGG